MKILLSLIILAFIAFIFFEGYTRFQIQKDEYPEAFVYSFMSTCKLGEQNCSCLLEQMQQEFTYKQMNALSEEEKDISYRKHVDYCKNKAGLMSD